MAGCAMRARAARMASGGDGESGRRPGRVGRCGSRRVWASAAVDGRQRTWCPVSGWGTRWVAWAGGPRDCRLRAARWQGGWRASWAGREPSSAAGLPGRWCRRCVGLAAGAAAVGSRRVGGRRGCRWTATVARRGASPLAMSSSVLVRCSWSDIGPPRDPARPEGGRPARGRSRAQRPPRAPRPAVRRFKQVRPRSGTPRQGCSAQRLASDRRAVTGPPRARVARRDSRRRRCTGARH